MLSESSVRRTLVIREGVVMCKAINVATGCAIGGVMGRHAWIGCAQFFLVIFDLGFGNVE